MADQIVLSVWEAAGGDVDMICKHCGGSVEWIASDLTKCMTCLERNCQIVTTEEDAEDIQFESVKVEDEDGYFDVEFKPGGGDA